ncbi:E3 ubiquitin-protein ligase TRIM21-like protein [Lates japonicus]|uniref:E3 ubiquitin-protein ligase TRIM21-like protein n=1 Tax=Lates japonicus TaxID=270547 RepID=A0AAD3QXQ1_LATJO|nr:E3 ubiquitin-protein ligase TRIM21-like protein [Lates japonicus]
MTTVTHEVEKQQKHLPEEGKKITATSTGQWFLKQNEILEGFLAIPEAWLERADRPDTVDLMVQKYGSTEALGITIKILKKISRNDLAQGLSSSRLEDLKNHDPILFKREYKQEKAELEKTNAEIKLMIQERKMKILEIKCSAEFSKKSADRHITDSRQAFTELQTFVERSLANLIEAIEEKQKTTQKQTDGVIQELEQEISELTKRSAEVELLSHTKDHLNFLQSFPSLNAIPPTKTWTEISIPLPSYGRNVGSVANQLKEELANKMDKLIAKAKLNRVKEFAVDVTLDPDTASPHLILSDDGKQVYCSDAKQNLPDNPERFNTAVNVLGKQSFSSGRFYYEVQVKGKTSWDLGIVKESINRKGSIKATPETGYWTICLRNGEKYRASAVDPNLSSNVYLNVKYPPKTVGVFVDYEVGMVSFFDVEAADIIYSFTGCSFTGKLYPFFSPSPHHHGKNSAPLIISPVTD